VKTINITQPYTTGAGVYAWARIGEWKNLQFPSTLDPEQVESDDVHGNGTM
jgi:hypothetical protein